MAAHLKRFYEEFLDTYQKIVDLNFPTLRNAFGLRSKLPLRVYIEPHVSIDRHSGQLGGTYAIVKQPLRGAAANEVTICKPGELDPGQVPTYRGEVIVDGRGSFLNPVEHLTDQEYRAPLSEMVYGQIGSELQAAIKQLREQEGVGPQ